MKQEKNITWLIGAGPMAVDYTKVLKALNVEFVTVARGKENALKFKEATGCEAVTGGFESFFKKSGYIPKYVINSVGIDKLTEVNLQLIDAGIKNILVEKPAVAYPDEVYAQAEMARKKNVNVVLAYNRRFYQSVIAAKKIIAADGGVTSFNFEFTEWSHSIEGIKHLKTQAELQNWFFGNSTHVIDLAFYLGGMPSDICCYHSGKDLIEWHNTSSNYSGAGITKAGALFAYHGNWKAPGRFVVEILTSKHRLVFKPLEKLQVQNLGSVAINMAEDIDYSLDELYKPGLYLQTKAFLDLKLDEFCTLQEQADKTAVYKKMSGYK